MRTRIVCFTLGDAKKLYHLLDKYIREDIREKYFIVLDRRIVYIKFNDETKEQEEI